MDILKNQYRSTGGKSQILFYIKSRPQNFIRVTLDVAKLQLFLYIVLLALKNWYPLPPIFPLLLQKKMRICIIFKFITIITADFRITKRYPVTYYVFINFVCNIHSIYASKNSFRSLYFNFHKLVLKVISLAHIYYT